jgi:hypothetical protein
VAPELVARQTETWLAAIPPCLIGIKACDDSTA